MISLFIVNEKEKIDITNFIETIEWSGNYKQACRMLEFSIVASSMDNSIPKLPIQDGNMVLFYENGKELFRGFVYKFGKTSSQSNITYTCYDYGMRLNTTKISYNVKNANANEVINRVAADYGLRKGNIPAINTRVSKVFIGTTIYELFMTMLYSDSKISGSKYMIDYSKGLLNVIKKGIVRLKVSFEEGKNLLDSSYSESIEKLVNKVLIVDETGNIKSSVTDANSINRFGEFQDIFKMEEGKDNISEAKSMLQGIEQTCSLEGYGDTSCVTGYGVTVKDNFTGLVGLFYIDSDSHKWEGGDYSISLGLNFKNLMDEVEAGEEENKDSSSGTKVTGGHEVDAIFTAYTPTGHKTANGETTKPSSLTCAMPKSVPFNTKIQIKGTSTDRDNLVYRNNDTGGMIVIDSKGYYHIDLLMATESEAIKFGRRVGKAIIGVEVTNYSNDGTSSEKARKAVSFANSKVGNSYVWGATGPNSFDCSGLTMMAYKSVGINIPRTSREQSTFGKSVSKDHLQTGDLIFFDTKGGGYVTHVAIYEGNGVFIHASSPKNGIKKSKITESYYVKAFKGARRVV